MSNENKINKQQAKQIVQQALSSVKATIQEHNLIQQAIMVLAGDAPEHDDLPEEHLPEE